MSTTSTKRVYKFGTSGYRSDAEDGFNLAVVTQITHAISDYLIGEIEKTGQAKPVLIGGDTREKSQRFIPVIANLLVERGLDVYWAEGDLPTPALAYAAKHFGALGLSHAETAGAILMTASHNPWEYGGFNFLTPDAAVVPSAISKQFEALQQEPANRTLDRQRFGLNEPAQIRSFNPYTAYKQHLQTELKIDFARIREVGLHVYYDPLYATGRTYFPRLLEEAGIGITAIHMEATRPVDYQGMPEPTGSNLQALAELVRQDTTHPMKAGFANDGDADRFGILDETGAFVSADDVLALILYHLTVHRKETGVVVRSQATSHLLDALAERAGLSVMQTPVGYKYIAEEFIEREEQGETPVLLGGEQSGGLSIKHHIPEKDGILANLLVAELIATEGRPLSEILQAVHDSVPQKFVTREFGIKTDRGADIMVHFQSLVSQGGDFAGLTIDAKQSTQAVEALERKFGIRDGAKVYFTEGSWLLIRASGTEPMVRVYLESTGQTADAAREQSNRLLRAVQEQLSAQFGVSESQVKEKL